MRRRSRAFAANRRFFITFSGTGLLVGGVVVVELLPELDFRFVPNLLLLLLLLLEEF